MRIRLKPGREKSWLDGHPWLYSGAVDAIEGDPEPIAEVVAADARLLGVGLVSRRSQIRVRRLSDRPILSLREFFAARLLEAIALRTSVVSADTDGFRLVNSEGDGLPGWTIDRFGPVLVSQIAVDGLETLRDVAYAALGDVVPGPSILHLGESSAREREGLSIANRTIRGEIPERVEFRESGLTFTADLGGGQKTGFYCDQRENRRLVERLARGRSVLDLFAYAGAFGLYALRGGATRVVAVDSSARSIEIGRAAYSRNGFGGAAVEWVEADVFSDLRRERRDLHEIVVCDPPPLAPRRDVLDAAARAYKDVNRLALKRVAPGGFFLTFSCSGAVDGKLFRQILFAAAVEAEVRLSLLGPLGAAPDHPFAVTHPEGEYLRGWWGVVEGPAR